MSIAKGAYYGAVAGTALGVFYGIFDGINNSNSEAPEAFLRMLKYLPNITNKEYWILARDTSAGLAIGAAIGAASGGLAGLINNLRKRK